MKKLLAVFLFVVAGTFLCGNALALSTYIPHITGGSADWTDYLQVNNNSPSAANFTLILYNKGNQVYSQTLTVGALIRGRSSGRSQAREGRFLRWWSSRLSGRLTLQAHCPSEYRPLICLPAAALLPRLSGSITPSPWPVAA